MTSHFLSPSVSSPTSPIQDPRNRPKTASSLLLPPPPSILLQGSPSPAATLDSSALVTAPGPDGPVEEAGLAALRLGSQGLQSPIRPAPVWGARRREDRQIDGRVQEGDCAAAACIMGSWAETLEGCTYEPLMVHGMFLHSSCSAFGAEAIAFDEASSEVARLLNIA